MEQGPEGISRRQAIKKVAIGGTALGGAMWIAPSIVTTVAAHAATTAGSGPPPTTTTTSPHHGTTTTTSPHQTTTTTSPHHVTTTTAPSTTTTTISPTKVLGATVDPNRPAAITVSQPLTTQAGATQGTLPFTGMDVLPVVAAGLTLIGGGAAVAAAASHLPAEATVRTED